MDYLHFIHAIRKKYKDLTYEELNGLLELGMMNGCGPEWFKYFNIKPPRDIFFEADCWYHDFGYTQGYLIKSWYRVDQIILGILRKIECDWKFYCAMIKDSTRSNNPIYYVGKSTIYFILVIMFGWVSFNWQYKIHSYPIKK